MVSLSTSLLHALFLLAFFEKCNPNHNPTKAQSRPNLVFLSTHVHFDFARLSSSRHSSPSSSSSLYCFSTSSPPPRSSRRPSVVVGSSPKPYQRGRDWCSELAELHVVHDMDVVRVERVNIEFYMIFVRVKRSIIEFYKNFIRVKRVIRQFHINSIRVKRDICIKSLRSIGKMSVF